MFSGIKSYLYGALAAIVSVFGAAAWWYKEAAQDANKAARKAEHKARRNEAARKHVKETNEATHEVEESNNRRTDDGVRQRLRDEYTASGSD